ncbi:MAG: hypothetical protein M3141_07150, partial [Actinomycetota bacterium]|nr:hypothetical protein [Actinomycetota bacterium]
MNDPASASAEDLLARVLAYPFGVPRESYALAGGRAEEPRTEDLEPGERIGVLAYGANASPAALTAKLGELAEGVRVPVLAAELGDFDVVYSAHVSPYGAIPAALQHSPGAVASVHVVHLTRAQLARVDRTEPNYELVRLHGLDLRLEGGRRTEAVRAWVSRHGCLRRRDGHVGVAAVPVHGRTWPARSEEEILAAVRDELAPGEPLG